MADANSQPAARAKQGRRSCLVSTEYAGWRLPRWLWLQSQAQLPQYPLGKPAPVSFFTVNQLLERKEGTPVSAAPAGNQSDEPFGLFEFSAPEGPLWVKWRGVETALRAEENVLAQCRAEPDQCGRRQPATFSPLSMRPASKPAAPGSTRSTI
jgi:hypothetical protein